MYQASLRAGLFHSFMMGDNRDNSQDSRYRDSVGYISRDSLIGPVALRLWNTNGMTMKRPAEGASTPPPS